MTRTVVFSGHNQVHTAAGNTTAPGTSVASLLRKAFGASPLPFSAALATNGGSAAKSSDWMTADIRRNMSPRAQRLMRADY